MNSPRREALLHALPYARRYARALTGTQEAGDALVGETIKDMLADGAAQHDALLGLYRGVTLAFERIGPAGAQAGIGPGGPNNRQRQLLLLTSLEELSVERAAGVIGLSIDDAERELAEARERLRSTAATDVLIIEDEPIIAMDIEELVQACGHRVVGIASTEAEAIELARTMQPGLILADINLGAGGDGAKAVARILAHHQTPVIFVTAYPERVLTGEAAEPAFIITKPFEPLTLAITTYQAVTGGVTLA